jgi:hypothetical protein
VISENSEQQNYKIEETSEAKWENIKKVVTAVVSEVVGYEERKKRNGWFDKECQIKAEERNRARKMVLNERRRMNTENYKNKRREAKKGEKYPYDLKELEGMEKQI